MTQLNETIISLLMEYEDWEASLIADNAMWWPYVEKDRISGKAYDKMLELQQRRNDILSKLKSLTEQHQKEIEKATILLEKAFIKAPEPLATEIYSFITSLKSKMK